MSLNATTIAATYDKCDTKDTLCNDCDETCATMLKTLEMSAMEVYMVRQTHLRNDSFVKPPKQAYVHYTTLNILKYDKC